jgi:hypothetical protein
MSNRGAQLQGTNAHAVLRQAVSGSPISTQQAAATAWQAQRFWFAPPAHALLHSTLAWRSAGKGLEVAMQTSLQRGALAYLCDHQIQVHPKLTLGKPSCAAGLATKRMSQLWAQVKTARTPG